MHWSGSGNGILEKKMAACNTAAAATEWRSFVGQQPRHRSHHWTGAANQPVGTPRCSSRHQNQTQSELQTAEISGAPRICNQSNDKYGIQWCSFSGLETTGGWFRCGSRRWTETVCQLPTCRRRCRQWAARVDRLQVVWSAIAKRQTVCVLDHGQCSLP